MTCFRFGLPGSKTFDFFAGSTCSTEAADGNELGKSSVYATSVFAKFQFRTRYFVRQ